MSNRREFTDKQKVEIFQRANGCCERCKRKVVGKLRPHYDHSTPDAVADKSKPLTSKDGQLLCSDCHDKKTNEQSWGPASKGDKTEIAKTDRIIRKAAGVKKRGRPLPGTKASGMRKRMDGTVERWNR